MSCGLADIDNVHAPVFSRVESECEEGGALMKRGHYLCSLSFVNFLSVLEKEPFGLKVLAIVNR